jgi:hypothetical protein
LLHCLQLIQSPTTTQVLKEDSEPSTCQVNLVGSALSLVTLFAKFQGRRFHATFTPSQSSNPWRLLSTKNRQRRALSLEREIEVSNVPKFYRIARSHLARGRSRIKRESIVTLNLQHPVPKKGRQQNAFLEVSCYV